MPSNENYPEGALVEVRLTVRLPVGATEDQIDDWLKQNVGLFGSIDEDNPLLSYSPEAWGTLGFDWEDKGVVGREERFDYEDLGEGRSRYRVRYLQQPWPAAQKETPDAP